MIFAASCYLAGQFAKKRRRERMEEELSRKPYLSEHPLGPSDSSRAGRNQKITPISTPRAAVGLGRQERFVPSWYNPGIAAATPNVYGTTAASKL